MRSIKSGIVLAAPIVLWLSLAPPPVAADNSEPAQAAAQNAVEIYKQGDDFVVAVYHPDGSATLAVVAYTPDKRRAGKPTSTPTVDELIKTGRVKYTIRLNPAQPSPAEARQLSSLHLSVKSGAAGEAKSKKLGRQQRVRLQEQGRTTVRALQTASEALNRHP